MQRRTILKSLPALSFLNTNNTTPPDAMVKRIVKPKRLNMGDTLGLIAPAGPVSDETIEKSLRNLTDLGFKVKLGKNLRAQNGYLAGSDAQRLEDFHWAFSDKEVNAVWCIRGGYGATRVLPNIDFSIIKKNPKIFIGYSDITAYHTAIFQKTGLVTFHGPVGASDYTDYTKPYVWDILTKPTPQYILKNSEENLNNPSNLFKLEVIKAGMAQGKLIGGNLTLLSAICGTPFALKSVKGKILFLEDIEERPYRVDRMLTQLMQSVDLSQAAGIALGIFEGCNPKEGEKSLSLIECIKDRLGHFNMPIIYGLSIGHIKNQYTLPIGIEAVLNTEGGTITLVESAVI